LLLLPPLLHLPLSLHSVSFPKYSENENKNENDIVDTCPSDSFSDVLHHVESIDCIDCIDNIDKAVLNICDRK
jgi:uncharacterized Fe-S center protein